uniref:Uncharacterized protein LOC100182250 n=1 Tax=Phallusia mammillata TaxID=59560 RepID=A0A6F9DHU5_9ASCI|nr:uncharacterized protein LOC100182250 [Phallusia mammillata]
MRLQLFTQLCQLESNENPYYRADQFQTKEDYQKWYEEEQKTLFKLLGDNFPSDKSVHEAGKTCRNHVEDYQSLILKILKHEAGYNAEKHDSVTRALSDADLPQSTSSPHNNHSFLPSKAERLLCEFSHLFRINPVTQHVVFLQCIKLCCEDGIFQFGDQIVLWVIKKRLADLMSMLLDKTSKNVILGSELEFIVDFTAQAIEWIKQLMCSFVSQWKPDHVQLSSVLALLSKCYEFQAEFGDAPERDLCDYVQRWLECAIKDDYISRKQLRCACDDPCGQSASLKLLRAVNYATHSLLQEVHDIYQSIFERYIQNIGLLRASVLYDCVLNDVAMMGEGLMSKEMFEDEQEICASVVIASKLAEFEMAVFKTGYKLQLADIDRSWREVCSKFTPLWVKCMSQKMSGFILQCMRDDEPVNIKTFLSSSSRNTTDDETSSDSSSDCIITRVEQPPSGNRVPVKEESPEIPQGANRLRMNTIISHSQSEVPHHAESTLADSNLFNTTGQKKAQTTETRGADLKCVATTSFDCSRAAVDFLVLVNRFIAFSAQTIDVIYRLPQQWSENRTILTNKDTFVAAVFTAMSSVINQYCDCTLNLDLCLFPKINVSQFVSRERRRELKERRRNGTVDCCRHQMRNNKTPCIDPVGQESLIKRNSVYGKMARRSNNVFLICEGLNAIWDRLSLALDIPLLTLSTGTSMRGFSGSTMSVGGKAYDSEYAPSEASNVSNRSRSRAVSEPLKVNNNTKTDPGHLANASCDVIKHRGDKNPDGDEVKADVSTHTPENDGRECSPISATCSNVKECVMKSTDLQRPRSATEGCLTTQSSFVGVFANTMSSVQTYATTTLQSLSSMWGFRIGQLLVEKVEQTLNTFTYNVRLTRSSLEKDLVTCERHCGQINASVRETLNISLKWFCGHPVEVVQETLWKHLISKLGNATRSLKDHGDSAHSRAFLLLVLYRCLLKEFASVKVLTVDEMSDNLQGTLSILELFLMPTPKVVGFHTEIMVKNPNQPLSGEMIRFLCRQQKSFSGQQLLARVMKMLENKVDPMDVKTKAHEVCSEMLGRGTIRFVFVRISSKNQLPELVECIDSLTSSCDSVASENNSWLTATPDSNSQTPVSNCATSSPFESDNDSDLISSVSPFTADCNHFYTFAFNNCQIPLYHFNGLDDSDLQTEFLEDILATRRRRDRAARDFFRDRGVVKRWFHFCSCVS